MVGVGVHVDERRAARARDREEPIHVASLGHVDHALQHGGQRRCSCDDGVGRAWVASPDASTANADRSRAAAVRLLGRGRAAAAVRRRSSSYARLRRAVRRAIRCGSPTTCSSTSRSTADRIAREGCLRPDRDARRARARAVPRVRLGTLVLLEALRPAAVLAKALATVDCVSGGRLDVGLGAGWYEPEYAALGMEMPRPGRAARPARRRARGREGSARRRTVHATTARTTARSTAR